MTDRANGKRLTESTVRESMHMAHSSDRWQQGYDLHPIRLAAAIATQSKWRDGFVTEISPEGTIEITDLDGVRRSYWSARLNLRIDDLGAPVAVNVVYDVLSIDGEFLSVEERA